LEHPQLQAEQVMRLLASTACCTKSHASRSHCSAGLTTFAETYCCLVGFMQPVNHVSQFVLAFDPTKALYESTNTSNGVPRLCTNYVA
jgi:hypothetical protein